MITFKHYGNFKRAEKLFGGAIRFDPRPILEKYGKQGVLALAEATPKDSGLTASSWDYEITKTGNGYSISWTNSNIIGNFQVAIAIQYGHGTGNGGYVEGHDFINPVTKSIFKEFAERIYMEVTNL